MPTRELKITRQQLPELVNRRITRMAERDVRIVDAGGESVGHWNQASIDKRTTITLSISNDSLSEILDILMRNVRVDSIAGLLKR